MNFIERKEKLDYLLEMIEKEQCFSISQLAEKFECSERTIRRMINELRYFGHEIEYSKSHRKFFKKN